MKEAWKRRFFILLGLLALCLFTLVFFITRPPEEPLIETEISAPTGDELVTLQLQLSEAEVKELILQEIEKRGYELHLNLSPKFQLEMPVNLAGQSVTFYLEGEAREAEGNIRIEIEKTVAGQLSLPKKLALNILSLTLPSELPLYTRGESLVIDLNKLNQDSAVKLHAETFRPKEADYQFVVEFPKKMIFEGMEEAH